jgi:hypothetical protein
MAATLHRRWRSQTPARADAIHHPTGDEESAGVGQLEREDDVGVVDLAPAELRLEGGLQDADHLTIDVIDRRGKEQERADHPSHVTGADGGLGVDHEGSRTGGRC